MSIAEYQLSLKNLIDATTDETILKRWKLQLEADLKQVDENTDGGKQSPVDNESSAETKSSNQHGTSDYVVIESGLGIDE